MATSVDVALENAERALQYAEQVLGGRGGNAVNAASSQAWATIGHGWAAYATARRLDGGMNVGTHRTD